MPRRKLLRGPCDAWTMAAVRCASWSCKKDMVNAAEQPASTSDYRRTVVVDRFNDATFDVPHGSAGTEDFPAAEMDPVGVTRA